MSGVVMDAGISVLILGLLTSNPPVSVEVFCWLDPSAARSQHVSD